MGQGQMTILQDGTPVHPFSFKQVTSGQHFLGCVKEVKDLELVVALPNRLFGIVPCNRISSGLTEIFSKYAAASDESGEVPSLKKYYKTGEFVACTVVTCISEPKKKIELSMEPSADLTEKEELANGLIVSGSITSQEDRGWIVDLGNGVKGFCPLSKVEEPLVLNKTCLLSIIHSPTSKASPVLQLSAKTLRLNELFFKSATPISPRLLGPGCLVEGLFTEDRKVQLSGGVQGVFDCPPFWEQPLKVGDKLKVRIVYSFNSNSFLVSCRPSVLSLSCAQQIVSTGMILDSIVTLATKRGFYAKCGDHVVYAPKLKASDEKLKEGKELKVRVTEYDIFNAIYVVSHEQEVLSAQFISYEGIKIGDLVKGEVVKIAEFGLLVKLSDRIKAICPIFHLSDLHAASSRLLQKYSVGQSYRFRVLESDPETKKITLSRRQLLISSKHTILSTLASAKKDQYYDGYVVSVKENGAVVRFYGSLTAFLPIAELSDEKFVEKTGDVLQVGQSVSVRVKLVNIVKAQLIVSLKSGKKTDVAPKFGAELEDQEVKQPEVKKQKRVVEEVQESFEPQVKKTKKATLAKVVVQEPIIPSQVQEKLTKNRLAQIFEQLPETTAVIPEAHDQDEKRVHLKIKTSRDITDEFEKRLLSTPNASAVWIEYAAALVSIMELDTGRSILERALKAISIREQSEKLNVWTALLNLENIYGSVESLKKVFERACQYNEPKHLHLRLAEIYEASGKFAEAGELYGQLQKKFRQSCKVWLASFVFALVKSKDQGIARRIFTSALAALPARKHIKITSKVAGLEYKYGTIERGRTLFEGLLANNPKRIDLWSVYITQEGRLADHSSVDHVRRIYERALTMKLSSKKAKFFFKNYLTFEKCHGDEIGVERVKQLARDYVESK